MIRRAAVARRRDPECQRLDQRMDQIALGIGEDITLASLDLLGTAPEPPTHRSLNRLAKPDHLAHNARGSISPHRSFLRVVAKL